MACHGYFTTYKLEYSATFSLRFKKLKVIFRVGCLQSATKYNVDCWLIVCVSLVDLIFNVYAPHNNKDVEWSLDKVHMKSVWSHIYRTALIFKTCLKNGKVKS